MEKIGFLFLCRGESYENSCSEARSNFRFTIESIGRFLCCCSKRKQKSKRQKPVAVDWDVWETFDFAAGFCINHKSLHKSTIEWRKYLHDFHTNHNFGQIFWQFFFYFALFLFQSLSISYSLSPSVFRSSGSMIFASHFLHATRKYIIGVKIA